MGAHDQVGAGRRRDHEGDRSQVVRLIPARRPGPSCPPLTHSVCCPMLRPAVLEPAVEILRRAASHQRIGDAVAQEVPRVGQLVDIVGGGTGGRGHRAGILDHVGEVEGSALGHRREGSRWGPRPGRGRGGAVTIKVSEDQLLVSLLLTRPGPSCPP